MNWREWRSIDGVSRGSLDSVNDGYSVEFGEKCFVRSDAKCIEKLRLESHSVSGYLYHQPWGMKIQEPKIRAKLPRKLKAPGLPTLNPSQEAAIRNVLQEPLSLIQGPPGKYEVMRANSIPKACKLTFIF